MAGGRTLTLGSGRFQAILIRRYRIRRIDDEATDQRLTSLIKLSRTSVTCGEPYKQCRRRIKLPRHSGHCYELRARNLAAERGARKSGCRSGVTLDSIVTAFRAGATARASHTSHGCQRISHFVVKLPHPNRKNKDAARVGQPHFNASPFCRSVYCFQF